MLTYATYVSQLANLLVISSADSNFQTALPGIIDQGEQRIYRELDLLATRVTDSTAALSSGDRLFTLPTDVGAFLVVEEIKVITPATSPPSSGTQNTLTNVSQEWLDMAYPGNLNTGLPQYWAMRDNAHILVGPSPDAPYPVHVVGTQRPTPLSSGNSSTILTQMLPDLFMTASCAFGAAYLKNFGAAQDDPRSGMSWENLYQKEQQSALTEETRKKYQSQGWTSKNPSPVSTPPRS